MDFFQEKAFSVIDQAVVSVPGIVSYANYKAKTREQIKTDDINQAVELQSIENSYKFKVHIVLMNGININEILEEVQSRISDGLDKLAMQNHSYIIDVVVDDLIVM